MTLARQYFCAKPRTINGRYYYKYVLEHFTLIFAVRSLKDACNADQTAFWVLITARWKYPMWSLMISVTGEIMSKVSKIMLTKLQKEGSEACHPYYTRPLTATPRYPLWPV